VLAKAHLAKGDIGSAETEAQWLVADAGHRVQGLVMLAQVRVAQKRFDDAADLLRQARREAKAAVPMLSFVEGDVLARRGRIADAKESFRAETAQFPRNREAYVRLAVLQTLGGNLRDAEKTFERMTAVSPDPSSYALAADTFERLGQRAAAARWRKRG
jgi:predicted Zn-dependent protease